MHSQIDQQARVLELIGRVYDAALDDKLWADIAPQTADTFGSTSTAVHLRNTRDDGANLLAMTQNYDGMALETYTSYYAQRDVWVQRAVAFGLSKVVASKDLISDAEFERTEICSDWAKPLGIFYLVGAVFPVSNDELGVLGIHRPRASGNYTEDEKALVGQFLPHLQRALQIRRRLADPAIERGAALDALERSGTATVVAGRDGRVLYANNRAERLLRAGEGLRAIGGHLAVAERGAAERLTALIRAAADAAAGRGTSTGGALALARADRLPLTVLVAPFRPAREGLGAPVPAAILFLRDPEAPSPNSLALQGLFGLTAAEATVAARLADGQAIDAIAGRLGISLNTARTHLKSIFLKTGTNRQPELVAVVLRGVAALGSP